MNEEQKKLEEKQDLNSKRAYHNRAKALAISYQKDDDTDKRRIQEQWGVEDH